MQSVARGTTVWQCSAIFRGIVVAMLVEGDADESPHGHTETRIGADSSSLELLSRDGIVTGGMRDAAREQQHTEIAGGRCPSPPASAGPPRSSPAGPLHGGLDGGRDRAVARGEPVHVIQDGAECVRATPSCLAPTYISVSRTPAAASAGSSRRARSKLAYELFTPSCCARMPSS